MALPDSVRELADREFSPIEEIILSILRDGLPDVLSVAEYPHIPSHPLILVRRDHGMGSWEGDMRFVDRARVLISTITCDETGLEGSDAQGAILQEAVRQVLKAAFLDRWHDPDLGSIIKIRVSSEASREADWATSAGPVQYLDLPTNWVRYESTYGVTVRKPRSS